MWNVPTTIHVIKKINLITAHSSTAAYYERKEIYDDRHLNANVKKWQWIVNGNFHHLSLNKYHSPQMFFPKQIAKFPELSIDNSIDKLFERFGQKFN